MGSISQENLDKPLILRDSNTKLIKVNFDPQVCFPLYFVYILCTLLAPQRVVFAFSTVTCYLHLSEVARLKKCLLSEIPALLRKSLCPLCVLSMEHQGENLSLLLFNP